MQLRARCDGLCRLLAAKFQVGQLDDARAKSDCRVRSRGPFAPEKAGACGVGLKSRLFDDHLRLNLAAFDTLCRDVQLDEQGGPACRPSKITGAARIPG